MLRALVLVLLLSGTASAHVPTFAEPGGSPEAAFFVKEPDESRVFYDDLGARQQHWFRFERQAGEPIDVSVHLPAKEPGRPTLWIVGPGISGEGPQQTPPGMGGFVVPSMDEVDVEPFTPLAMRAVAESDLHAPENGTYYAVIEADQDLSYSVAIGLGESFTLAEWVSVPMQRVGIMDWAGIGWPTALFGEAAAVTAAVVLAVRRKLHVREVLGFGAAAALAGTAVTTIVLAIVAGAQGGFGGALVVPLVFASIAFGTGYWAYHAVHAGKAWIGLLIAPIALFLWAGLIAGPAALVAWSVWRFASEPKPGAPES